MRDSRAVLRGRAVLRRLLPGHRRGGRRHPRRRRRPRPRRGAAGHVVRPDPPVRSEEVEITTGAVTALRVPPRPGAADRAGRVRPRQRQQPATAPATTMSPTMLQHGGARHAAVRPAHRPRRSSTGPTCSTSSCWPTVSPRSPGGLRAQPGLDAACPSGYFGASTGAAAALWAAAEPDARIAAVVSRGGRPDLAGPRLAAVRRPTLLIVGGDDDGGARAQPRGRRPSCAA